MRGLVLYTKKKKEALEIKERLENQKGYNFEIKRVNELKIIPENIAYIAADWDVRLELIKLIQLTDVYFGVAFYNKAFFSDIDDTKDIDIALDNAIRQKNWEICKGINLFYLMGDIVRKRINLRSKPVKLQIETTDLCNARCIMCSHSYSEGTGIDILKSGILKKLESVLPFVKVIILHGNGEPFLKKDVTIYLQKMAEYGISFVANTNLSIVNDQLISFFNKSFIELTVSCDGHTKELYESIRKGLSFECFIRNVKRVRRQCPHLNMKMAVVVMRQNMSYLAEIVEFAAAHGFNEIIFNQLCVDEKNENVQDAAYLYVDELQEYTSEAIERSRQCNIKVVVPYMIDNTHNISTHDSKSRGICHGICDWLVECPYIDLRGNIALCCIKQKEYVGNIFETKFDQIWNGNSYVKVRDMFRMGKMPDSCNGCDFAVQGRLLYLTISNDELSLLEKKPRC